jgi:hypothetical protein
MISSSLRQSASVAPLPTRFPACSEEYVGVRQRQLKMPAKDTGKSDKTDDEKPQQTQPATERYLHQIDRQSKRSFKTLEAARTAALEIKSRFPTLQISVCDTLNGSRTVVR